jgi:GDSL-like Lipase/Acylhydrolase family
MVACVTAVLSAFAILDTPRIRTKWQRCKDQRGAPSPARMKKQAQTIGAFALVAMLTACSTNSPIPIETAAPVPVARPQVPAALRECSVTLYGDSILAGATFPNGRLAEPPAAAVRRMRPSYRTVDRALAGDNAQMRMPVMLRQQIDTRIVVLGHGLNDAANALPYEEPLRAMVKRARSQGRAVVITGISQTVGGTANEGTYNALAQRIAKEEGAIFANWGAVQVVAADMADPVHPGQRQSTRLVEHLVRTLDKVAPECSS